MIAKAIVWDESRPRAIEKMIRVLKDAVVFGVHTNIPYLIAILSHPEFINGTMTTRFIENNFSDGLKSNHNEEQRKKVSQETYKQFVALGAMSGEPSVVQPGNQQNPWAIQWRGI